MSSLLRSKPSNPRYETHKNAKSVSPAARSTKCCSTRYLKRLADYYHSNAQYAIAVCRHILHESDLETYLLAVWWTRTTVPSACISTNDPHRSFEFTRNRLRSQSTLWSSSFMDTAHWISRQASGLFAQTSQVSSLSEFVLGDTELADRRCTIRE
jgi:hypothetical protein